MTPKIPESVAHAYESVPSVNGTPNVLPVATPAYDETEPTRIRVQSIQQFLEEEDAVTAADSIVGDVIVRQALTGIAGKPKIGKTTLMMFGMAACAQGCSFLNRATTPVRCLWLNLEQPARLLRWKFAQVVEEPNVPNLLVATAKPSKITAAMVADIVNGEGVDWLCIDSLSKWWRLFNLKDENDNRAIEETMQAAREIATDNNAAFCFLHHPPKHRQQGTTVMDMFRGAGAIGADLDIGFYMSRIGKGQEHPTIRKLEAESRYDDTPPLLHVEYDHGTYRVVESPATAQATDERDAIAAVLNDIPQTAKEILNQADTAVSLNTLKTRLAELVEARTAAQGGPKGRAHTWVRVA